MTQSAEAWGQILKGESAARRKNFISIWCLGWGLVGGYMRVFPSSHPYSCWEGLRMYRKWVFRTGSLEWEEPWVPSSRLSSWVPSRSPSRMACRRCRFSLSQWAPSWTSWWDLRLGSFMIQKATRGWGSGWKLSTAFGSGTKASFSSILGTWGGGTERSQTPNDNPRMLHPRWHIPPNLPPTGQFRSLKLILWFTKHGVYKCVRIKNTEIYRILWD